MSGHMKQQGQGTYSIFLFIKHEGGNSLTLIGMNSCLSMNMDSGAANAEIIGGTWNSVEGRRHLMIRVMEWK